jgi:hypothetical protein
MPRPHQCASAHESREASILGSRVIAQQHDTKLGSFARDFIASEPTTFVFQIDVQEQCYGAIGSCQNACLLGTVHCHVVPSHSGQLLAQPGRESLIAVADDHPRDLIPLFPNHFFLLIVGDWEPIRRPNRDFPYANRTTNRAI